VKGNTLAARLLGAWKLAPLIRATTGIPINVTVGRDNSLTRSGAIGPTASGRSLPCIAIAAQWINPGRFVANATGTFGGLGRMRCALQEACASTLLSARISAAGEIPAGARAEGFNVINHANFNAPSGNLSSALSDASHRLAIHAFCSRAEAAFLGLS